MPPALRVRVTESAQVREYDLPARLVLGRQSLLPASRDTLECGPPSLLTRAQEPPRLVVAWNSEPDLARRHAQLESLEDGRVRVSNLNQQFPLDVSGLPGPLACGAEAVLLPPFRISLGRVSVTVLPAAVESGPQTLTGKTRAPGQRATTSPGLAPFPRLEPPQWDQLLAWLQETVGVLQGAAGSDDFLARAVEAMLNIVGLHAASVLLYRDGTWVPVSASTPGLASAGGPSGHVLGEVLGQGRTVWLHPGSTATDGRPSLLGIRTVVAAPLLDRDEQVIGALYGELRHDGPPTPYEDDGLRALLVEMLAGSVSAGLARQRAEHDRALFQQFFPEALADKLLRRPELIQEGREAEVTVLFCDIRNYSRASEKLGSGVVSWVSSVMERLSACVHEYGGVLVDYIGDELMAMWGAPEPQSDHALRATAAALAMLQARADLDKAWAPQLGFETDLGIGLHTGPAQVGNTGTKYKLKYGPLGDTVNVASRTQGLCKHLKCRLLVTRETRDRLGPGFAARRVVQVQFVGVPKPRHLYEVAEAGDPRGQFFAVSEEALDALEVRGDFPRAACLAGTLLQDHAGDGPLRLTLSRASEALFRDGLGFNAVWQAPGK
jgi:adenylate cyclase